jgi:intein-encoded DNA endonuclease-like protein
MSNDLRWFVEAFEAGLSLREMERQTGVSRKRIANKLASIGIRSTYKKALDEPEVLSLYEAMDSALAVADKLKVSPGTILRILRKNNVTIKHGKRDIDAERAELLYSEGSTLKDIGNSFGVDSSVVRRVLVERGVEIKSNSESHTKYTVDESFFSVINSEESAYWLGFMFADGYVKSNLRDFGITLSSKDREHLVRFVSDIGYDGPIRDYTSDPAYAYDYPYSRVEIASRPSCAALIARGCLPRKTHHNEAPTGVPKKYYRHFVRGVVDGDGYVGIYPGWVSLEIVGDRDLLEWIREVGPGGMSKTSPHKSVWRIRTNNREWLRWLYHDASVYLPRKGDKCQEI